MGKQSQPTVVQNFKATELLFVTSKIAEMCFQSQLDILCACSHVEIPEQCTPSAKPGQPLSKCKHKSQTPTKYCATN